MGTEAMQRREFAKEKMLLNDAAPRVYLRRPDHLVRSLMSRRQSHDADLTALRQVLSEYALELSADPQVLSGGNRSYSLLLHTSRGKKMLKRYKQSMDQSTIVQEHSILTHLAQVDFPSPRLMATRTGETWVCHGKGHYALFDFIDGGFQYHHYLLWPGQLERFVKIAGRMLALFHDALKDFVPLGYNPDGFRSQHQDRQRNLEWVLEKLVYCVRETSRSSAEGGADQAARLLQHAGHVEESLIQLDAAIKKAGLPRLIIHGDYGPYNLLFRRRAPVIVLDMEMARLDWRVSELVYAWHRFGYDRLGFRVSKMKWLLDAYQAHMPLTRNERQHLPVVWRFLYLRQCVMYWHRYCETKTGSYLDKAQWHLKTADWMTEHQGTLIQHGMDLVPDREPA